jgi:hypothetical protein
MASLLAKGLAVLVHNIFTIALRNLELSSGLQESDTPANNRLNPLASLMPDRP